MLQLEKQLLPFEAEARRMQGWQFEYAPDNITGPVPWHYETLAAAMASQANAVLDIGTGGGESFSNILESAPCDAFATESWPPNVAIAAQRLQGHAAVTHCASTALPFAKGVFDLVLARHEPVSPTDVSRVLNSGGRFFTQQVIHDFMFELEEYFPETVIFADFIKAYQDEFQQLGLRLCREQTFRYRIEFKTLGHLVYQLVAAPWTLPGFSVATHLAGLTALQQKQQKGDRLIFTAGYSLLEVQKDV